MAVYLTGSDSGAFERSTPTGAITPSLGDSAGHRGGRAAVVTLGTHVTDSPVRVTERGLLDEHTSLSALIVCGDPVELGDAEEVRDADGEPEDLDDDRLDGIPASDLDAAGVVGGLDGLASVLRVDDIPHGVTVGLHHHR